MRQGVAAERGHRLSVGGAGGCVHDDDHAHHDHFHNHGSWPAPDGAPSKPIDISGGDKFEDSQPVWSPDGKRLALARRLRTSDVTALARGIWLMDPDGRNAVAITSGPTEHDSAPQWSPDGQTIRCERVDTAQIGAEPTVWTFNVVTGAALEVAGDGYRAGWLP